MMWLHIIRARATTTPTPITLTMLYSRLWHLRQHFAYYLQEHPHRIGVRVYASEFPRTPRVGNSVNRGNLPLTALLFTVMFSVGEVAARNFFLYVGHLGRREPVVQPATLW